MVSLRKLHYIRFAVSYERRGQPAIYQAVKLCQRQGSALIKYPGEAIPLSLHLGVLNCSSIFNKLYCDILLLRVCEIELDCWNSLFKNLATLLVISVNRELRIIIDLIDLSFLLDLCYVVFVFLELFLKDEFAVLSNCVIRVC